MTFVSRILPDGAARPVETVEAATIADAEVFRK
jgi:hypothetical protein